MIRIGLLGDIGSGKSYIAKKFGYPVFNADFEVSKIYKTNKTVFKNLKKKLPKFFNSFPIKKNEVSNAILTNKNNLQKIVKIVHSEVRRKMKLFLDKNKNKKIVILDIPLLLENKINNKNDILVFVQSKKFEILKRLKKRKNFNIELVKRFQKIQLSLDYKKRKSQYVIKNDFSEKTASKYVKDILVKILK
tara:strand:+ start:2609 stop:3181 length:573 start_codon:yes stop_codon:yes gene_type:complete